MTSRNFEIFNITKHNKKLKKNYSFVSVLLNMLIGQYCLPNKQHSTMPTILASMELRTKSLIPSLCKPLRKEN